jgi:hypothetical protein
MTIVASVKVRDGIVLGTDSMTQITGVDSDGHAVFVKAYSNARKLFSLGDAQVGVMTWGLGNLDQQSIEGVVLDFRRTALDATASVGDIAQQLYDFVKPKWQAAQQASDLGFCIAGYSSPDAAFAEVYEFVLPRDASAVVASGADDFGLLWRGIDLPLIRLIKGVDPTLLADLLAGGMPQPDVEALIAPREWFLSQPGMPIQDAVNLVDYLLTTTIRTATFVDANPTCGGPLQVAAILPATGFEWISHPRLILPRDEVPT